MQCNDECKELSLHVSRCSVDKYGAFFTKIEVGFMQKIIA